MTKAHFCPTCGESYDHEDYCPVHFIRLVVPQPSARVDVEGATIDEARDTSGEPPAPDSTLDNGPAARGQARAGKLAQVMSRFGLRPVANEVGKQHAPPRQHSPSSEEAPSPLPPEVLEKGWRVSGVVRTGAGLDSWPVEMKTPSGSVIGHFQRYRTGALTTAATYRRLSEKAIPCMATIWAHGTVDFGGARADYDLITVPTAGVALDKWLTETQPSEQRALDLYPRMVRFLQRLFAAEIHPIVFEPSQLQRCDDGEICLTSAGAMAEVTKAKTEAAPQYRPEFVRSALLPQDWAAPELVQQAVLSANASLFSLGQVLAQAMWGQPCTYAELQTGATPFHTISDPRLARVLMGCLWVRSAGRWTYADLSRAADCPASDALPPVAPWASLTPGASSTSFCVAGESFWRLEDLLAAATTPLHWAEATSRIAAILEWAESTAWVGQAKLMRQALADGRSADWVLIRLARAVRPDAPWTWRALDLSDSEAAKNLASLAQRTLHGSTSDAAQLRDLFKADLRGAFTPAKPEHSTDK